LAVEGSERDGSDGIADRLSREDGAAWVGEERARKAEKRLRYAAELAEPADGHMKAVARKAKKLQTLLGEHQDAVVAANFLLTISAASDGENGIFTYGVLVANELNRAAEIRESLRN
jgi:CHAD domain-containing protein